MHIIASSVLLYLEFGGHSCATLLVSDYCEELSF